MSNFVISRTTIVAYEEGGKVNSTFKALYLPVMSISGGSLQFMTSKSVCIKGTQKSLYVVIVCLTSSGLTMMCLRKARTKNISSCIEVMIKDTKQ